MKDNSFIITSCGEWHIKKKLWYTSVNPTMLISGWVKQAAGMLKWFSTWSLPVTCSTTVGQIFHQMILKPKL